MDFNNLKEKITKKHIIIGTSAIVLIAGAITAGVALSGDSDKENTDSNLVAEVTEATTTTTAVTTTTAPQTTTTVTTTTKVTTTEKKKEEKKEETKTETKQESNSSSDEGYYEESYEEEYYEEPAYEYEYEEPKAEEAPKQEEAPAPEPEPEPEPVDDNGGYPSWYGATEKANYDYAISQGCTDAQASTYVAAVDSWGADRVMIGDPTYGNGGFWAVWVLEDPDTGHCICGG